MRMLLQRGASVNLQDSRGSTALMAAAFNGHTTIVQVLLDAKADASRQKIDERHARRSRYAHGSTSTPRQRSCCEQHAGRQAADDGGRGGDARRGRRSHAQPLAGPPRAHMPASRGGPSSTGGAAWRGASTRPRGGTRWRWRARRRPCC